MQKSLVEALQLAVDETDFTKVRFILSKVLSAMYNGQHLVDFSDGFPQDESQQDESQQGE